jgi:hypothetical protein
MMKKENNKNMRLFTFCWCEFMRGSRAQKSAMRNSDKPEDWPNMR